jgi:ureidoacrylate peracid hydrolase
MLQIDDQIVFTTLEEVVDPAHTALVVIDAQNDFCKEGGAFWENGDDLSTMPAAIAACGKLIETARAAGVQVIYIQNQKLPNNKSTSASWLRFLVARNGMVKNQNLCMVGSWGAQIVDELTPQDGDIVVQKWRSSAFVATNLDMILRTNGIKAVVCCGFITQGCVESTARDAGFYDYYPVVVEDAIANYHPHLHEASLMVQRTRYDVTTTSVVTGIWDGAVPQYAAAE